MFPHNANVDDSLVISAAPRRKLPANQIPPFVSMFPRQVVAGARTTAMWRMLISGTALPTRPPARRRAAAGLLPPLGTSLGASVS